MGNVNHHFASALWRDPILPWARYPFQLSIFSFQLCFPGNAALLCRCLVLAISALVAPVQAQWRAFNDHLQGPNSNPNCTFWSVFGTRDGAPGSAGYLKDVVTGNSLQPVTLTITNYGGVTGGGNMGTPAAGTPAGNLFLPYIDFGTGTAWNSIMVKYSASQTVGYTFTGLDPGKEYKFAGTAVRGDGTSDYPTRWTLCQLLDAQAAIAAHTANVITNANWNTLPIKAAAFNSGANDSQTSGDIIIWDHIHPSSNGSFTVTCRQYTGPTNAAGGQTGTTNYGYAFSAIMLQQYASAIAPAIVSAPQSQYLVQGQGTSFGVLASGYPLFYQWRKDGVDLVDGGNISGANTEKLFLSSTDSSDQGKYTVLVSNELGMSLSMPATLTILPVAHLLQIDVQAYIDGRDQLIIRNDTLQWHHLSYAAVGRHGGSNCPTIVSTSLDGVNVTNYNWIPDWPEPPPASINYECYSLISSNLFPALPQSPMRVVLKPIICRGSSSIIEMPSETNGFQIVVDFNDSGPGGTVWYDLMLDINIGEVTPPEILMQPASQIAVPGGSASFQVQANSPLPLHYQWRLNDVDLPGQTNTSLLLANLQPGDFGQYRVLVSVAGASMLSASATLSLAAAPQMVRPSYNGTAFGFTFNTEVGLTYIVEYKKHLEDAEWAALTSIPGTGKPAEFEHQSPTGPMEFYRVRVQ